MYGVFLHTPYGKGTYAQYIAVPEQALVAPAPGGVSLHHAAAVPTAVMSALALVQLASIGRGQDVLILCAGGGIGSFATQLAAARGARVIATARPQSFSRLERLGASVGVRRLFASQPDDGSRTVGDLEDVGEGRVLIALTVHAQMGDERVDLRATAVWTVQHSLVARIEWFPGGMRRTRLALEEPGLIARQDYEP